MEKAAADVSHLLKLLSNQNRLLILCQLGESEKSVGELANLLSVSQVTVSQQLAVLRNTGLVASRREAQTIYYSLANENVRRLIEFLYQTYCSEADTSAASNMISRQA